MNQTNGLAQNQTEIYGDTLMDVIRNANITIPSDLHLTTDQLEQIKTKQEQLLKFFKNHNLLQLLNFTHSVQSRASYLLGG